MNQVFIMVKDEEGNQGEKRGQNKSKHKENERVT